MNRSSNVFVDIAVYSMVVAGIFVMTNPTSQGPKFVSAATKGYADIVQASSGQKVTA